MKLLLTILLILSQFSYPEIAGQIDSKLGLSELVKILWDNSENDGSFWYYLGLAMMIGSGGYQLGRK